MKDLFTTNSLTSATQIIICTASLLLILHWSRAEDNFAIMISFLSYVLLVMGI